MWPINCASVNSVTVSLSVPQKCSIDNVRSQLQLSDVRYLHKLHVLRQNNVCLNVCFSVFKRSTEFL